MKKQITLIWVLLLSFVTYSQIKFEKGYFIDNNDKKTECLIKNEDWSNNPTSFKYKIDDTSSQKINVISAVKAFGIYNISKYERHAVKIDISNDNLQQLSKQRSPEWEEKTLFLKIISEGDATLFRYRKNSKNIYFYSKQDKKIVQLIYKKYELKSKQVASNLTFMNQLFKNVNCNNYALEKMQDIEYNNKYMINYFNKHNLCVDPENKNIVDPALFKSEFKFKINLGLNNSSLTFGNPNYSDEYTTDFGTTQSLRIGFETEIILPFNNRRWSLFIEPAYSYFKKSVADEFSYGGGTDPKKGTVKTIADLNLMEVSLGGRNYFYVPNEQIKMFADIGVIWGTFFSSKIEIIITPEEFQQIEIDDFFVAINFFGGIGVLIKNKINLEARFQSQKVVVVQNTGWKSNLNTFSFNIGYTFN